jgi:hypothetical protein
MSLSDYSLTVTSLDDPSSGQSTRLEHYRRQAATERGYTPHIPDSTKPVPAPGDPLLPPNDAAGGRSGSCLVQSLSGCADSLGEVGGELLGLCPVSRLPDCWS